MMVLNATFRKNIPLKKSLALILFALFICVTNVFAQSVKGVVKDGSGNSLPGISVKVRGTGNGCITDIDGKYNIKASNKDVLIFSCVGMKTIEIHVGEKSTINVTMVDDVSAINEVVVVGYGTQKKVSLTGAVSSIKSDEINDVPVSNVTQALVGKLPGLITRQESGEPGSDAVSMAIRGYSSANSSAPLVLVDGIERSMTGLDPNEVESVTILKDAATASIYGVRAASGVILITTKKGIKRKPTVTYSGAITLSENTTLPKYLDGEEYVKWWNYADEINGRSHTFSDAVVKKITNGDSDGIYGNTDWIKLMLKTAVPTQHHDLTLSGGNDDVRYFMALGYMNQKGIVKGVNYNRYNLRSNLDANVTKDFSLSLNISGQVADKNSPQISNFTANGNSVSSNLMSLILSAVPYLKPQTTDGKYLVSSLNTPYNNPLAARNESGYDDTDGSSFQSTLTMQYNAPFLKGLSFKISGSYDKNYDHAKSYYTPYSLYSVDPTSSSNTLTQVAAPYGTETILSESYAQSNRWTLQQYITYKNTFGKHAFDFVAVAEQSKYKYKSLGASAQDFDLNDLSEFAFAKKNPNMPTGSDITSSRASWVARLNYTYDNRYILEASSRIDGSTNFSSSNRWGLFPSVSAAWRISEERFFKNLNLPVENLKLRASYGTTGNDATNSSYAYMSFYSLTSTVANFGGTNVGGLLPTSVPNKNLTWEKTSTSNIGLDLDMWNGMLAIQCDYFYAITRDMLIGVNSSYPPSIGEYYTSTANAGKMDNRGFEFALTHRSKIGDFHYNISANINWAHNRILATNESAGIPKYESVIGHSLGTITGYVAEGLFKTDEEAATSPTVSSTAKAGDIKYKDLNGDGKITYDQDVAIIGKSSVPELTYGFNFSSSYKNFDLSFLIQGTGRCSRALMGWYDGIGWDDTQFTRDFYIGNTPKYLIENSWSPTNKNGKYPRLDNQWRAENNSSSTLWVINGAYLRMKNVQLSYTLPKSISRIVKFDAKFYIAATNLFTITKFKYVDPEAPNVSNGYYPQQRTYSFGMTLTF